MPPGAAGGQRGAQYPQAGMQAMQPGMQPMQQMNVNPQMNMQMQQQQGGAALGPPPLMPGGPLADPRSQQQAAAPGQPQPVPGAPGAPTGNVVVLFFFVVCHLFIRFCFAVFVLRFPTLFFFCSGAPGQGGQYPQQMQQMMPGQMPYQGQQYAQAKPKGVGYDQQGYPARSVICLLFVSVGACVSCFVAVSSHLYLSCLIWR